ncbi:MAG: S4 domain-containing protein YaaA [Fusobacteriaceae bacterium]|jgi:ribosome-associated protein|nr:S4 domain-containing protein YaaA [Fusobacteriaceae bacterium]
MKRIKIKGEYIKLDQLLKLSGIADTGGGAKNWILEGNVLVNGVKEQRRGKKIRPGDVVETAGEIIRAE